MQLREPPPVPADLGRSHDGLESTQQSVGRFFMDLAHEAPKVAAHVVSVSPDVASSTNLGGWINRVGVWSMGERIDWFADDSDTLVRWRESEHGRHIELGIAERNLVNRALEPWSFGIYAGGQSILVGTPAGVTLAPEGGAHQSIITPSVGLEQPRCVAGEPAFGQDLEWTLLHALGRLGRSDGTSAYLRLSTRPIDQSLACVPEDPAAREQRRRQVLAGGYRLRESAQDPEVTLVGMGAIVPELLAAAEELAAASIGVDVICLTSADLIFRALQTRQGLYDGDERIIDELFPPVRRAPIVTVLDGHLHTLSFLGAVSGALADRNRVLADRSVACLGVQDFGQSGGVQDLYRHFGIDAGTIAGVALELIK